MPPKRCHYKYNDMYGPPRGPVRKQYRVFDGNRYELLSKFHTNEYIGAKQFANRYRRDGKLARLLTVTSHRRGWPATHYFVVYVCFDPKKKK
jgi:hypothetical protein